MKSSYAQVTPIDALPELEDLEGQGAGGFGGPAPQRNHNHGPDPNANHIKQAGRMIRTSVRAPPLEAGMSPNGQNQGVSLGPNPMQQGYVDQGHNPVHADQTPQHGSVLSAESPLRDEGSLTKYNMPEGTPSCLDVAEHIANCPICSKFYNNDKTIYIIAIVILSIICLLLLKKVLNV
jgi:hypothetical protein